MWATRTTLGIIGLFAICACDGDDGWPDGDGRSDGSSGSTMNRESTTGLGSGGGGGACGNMAAMQTFNLDWINETRATTGLSPYVLDDCLSALAQQAVEEVADGGQVHGMFVRECIRERPNCTCNWQQENYGMAGSSQPDWQDLIDRPLASMMEEPKGTGHRKNIEHEEYTRLGVGIVCDGTRLSFVNTFGP